MMGGTLGGAVSNAVWTSSNFGATWTRLANAPWSPRTPSPVVVDGAIWVQGGALASGTASDWWSSSDAGRSWQLVSSTLPFVSVANWRVLTVQVAEGKLKTIRGYYP